MTATSHPIGGSPSPLVPTMANPPTGWSSSIDKGYTHTMGQGSNPAMGQTIGQGPHQATGWSSNISGTAQSGNWMAQSSTPMMTPMQPNINPSTNWSMPQMQPPAQSTNWMPQNQAPTAASLMMSGPALLPQGNPPKQQLPQASSDNPFVDLLG